MSEIQDISAISVSQLPANPLLREIFSPTADKNRAIQGQGNGTRAKFRAETDNAYFAHLFFSLAVVGLKLIFLCSGCEELGFSPPKPDPPSTFSTQSSERNSGSQPPKSLQGRRGRALPSGESLRERESRAPPSRAPFFLLLCMRIEL